MDRDRRQRKKDAAAPLMKELQGYERQGTHLYLGERPSGADEIASACLLAERSGYMRDLIWDDAGRITEIHFIRILERQI